MAKSPVRKNKSIEPIVSQWANEQLNKMSWKNTFEQESLNQIIETALKNALSKEGGVGGCRVDAQVMLKFGTKEIPVMIEYKGTKGDLEVLDKHNLINIKTDKNEYDFKTISKKAVNGAVYYASVILSATANPYSEIMAIGVNGWKDETEQMHYEVKAYLLNAENPNMPIFFKESSDLSFLTQEANILFEQIEDCQKTPEELSRKHRQDEDRLEKVLKELNQHLRDESRIQVNHRIAVVTPCIMAGLGVKNADGSYKVEPLKPEELKGSQEEGETDGDKIFRKVVQFLKERKIPDIKQQHIRDSLKAILLHQRLGLVDETLGYSPLKSAYKEVFDNIIPAYHLSGILDFTGKLFNVMNDWVAVPDGDKNDVVLTPRYVTDLMAQLTEVDRNSYVWDWALGSGGFLISAMNLMLQDNKNNATSEKERLEKDQKIKSKQLLGVEKLPDIYILAVLNMILMNDGSTNIINENSLTEYNGHYAYNEVDKFPANVFLLNPPYSAEGNGMIFVQKAFERMKSGKGAVIIQDSAGTGKAVEFNKKILKNNRLLASIKMPVDLFKASVQTSIYLFEIGKRHRENDYVKFIDFSDDGYTRTNRKKASSNLSGEEITRPRYQELVSVVKNGITPDCVFFKEGENYVLDKIAIEQIDEPKNTAEKKAEIQEHNAKVGCDWNFTQHKKINTKPTLADFKKTVADYLAWEVSQLLKQDDTQGK
ncbi:HsdM family class I SAM-dependent methyltransferase [Ursidibacter arcticus]